MGVGRRVNVVDDGKDEYIWHIKTKGCRVLGK